MEVVNAEVNKWYETLRNQALDKNEKSVATWSKYRDDLETTKSLLSLIPKKIKHNVMVPIGPKALMHGRIVHTNEFLVNLGETWFVKKTSHQTIELCDRRIKSCNEVLKKLEQERELIVNKSTLPTEQEAFGSEDRPEIIEYVTEEEDEVWRKQHRLKEKEYRQQLAELRNQEKKSIKTEEDLWRHLDELELQEELEDELNRLNAECNNEDYLSDENTESDDLPSQGIKNQQIVIKEDNSSSENKSLDNVKTKRKVSFVCDLDSSDDEPLRLEIRHSSQSPVPCSPDNEEINSPVDIYNHFLKLVNKMPLSVLKNKTEFNKNSNLQLISNYETDDEEEELNPPLSVGVHLNDISERPTSHVNSTQKIVDNKSKKVSKFKISRKKSE